MKQETKIIQNQPCQFVCFVVGQLFVDAADVFMHDLIHMSCVMRKTFFAYAKTKTQISFAVTAKLISAFVFAT